METGNDQRLIEAAQTGNIDALYALIQQDCYMLERIEHIPFVETPLHVAANKGQFSFFFLALEMMNLMPSYAKKLNQDGFSPMHLAVRNGHTELVFRLLKTDKDLAIKMLLDAQVWLSVRYTNSEGLTALEIIQKDELEEQGMNINMNGKNEANIKKLKENVKISSPMKAMITGNRARKSLSVDMINTMLVIMALVITAAYQSALSPPGGVWQGEGRGSSTINTASGISTTNHFFPDYTEHVPLLKESREVDFPHFMCIVVPLSFLVISYFCSVTILAPTTTFSYFNLGCTCLMGILPPLALFVANYCAWKHLEQMRENRAEMRKVLGMDKDPRNFTLTVLGIHLNSERPNCIWK
ncbi:hypothetical protein F3Y22_tig00111617pilonHSYRG00024 [Hibiscus syriacus]|uniref:PGG domain-containing protein n=1 Tax=Hibiscus syriacus TaxID=106335 RepID=A0A6A2XLC5_HIBSY|nr:hypothetical protein F3Y22_tig00111617pilonHSYRG00024 [Hibiscus syriacus]